MFDKGEQSVGFFVIDGFVETLTMMMCQTDLSQLTTKYGRYELLYLHRAFITVYVLFCDRFGDIFEQFCLISLNLLKG